MLPTTPPPPRYGELARFFATPESRARALGVSRRLVAALDRGEDSALAFRVGETR